MPLNPDAERLITMVASRGQALGSQSPTSARQQQTERTVWANGSPESVAGVRDTTVPTTVGGVPVRIYASRVTDDKLPIFAFFHGGGWVTCDLDTHDALCRALVNRVDCLLVSVGYPLAPEAPFPAGLDACWDVTSWLAGHGQEIGGDPGRLAVGGDSAGGNLAAVVAIRARDHGLPLALQALLYPILDHRLDQPEDARCPTTFGLTREGLRFYYSHYLADPAEAGNPEVSPYRAQSLKGLPDAYVITCEYDPLLPEAEDYVARLVQDGVPVSYKRYFGQIHGFMRATGVIGEAWEAVDHLAHALRGAFAQSSLKTAGGST